jgi:hypothetical protein
VLSSARSLAMEPNIDQSGSRTHYQAISRDGIYARNVRLSPVKKELRCRDGLQTRS